MNKALLVIASLTIALLLAACDTGDTADQPNSAQNLQPNITGFTREDTDNATTAFATALGAGSLATGNAPLAAAIERANTALQCLGEAGAVSGFIYRETQASGGIIPQTGISFVINQTRVERNLIGCIADLPFSAQSVLEVRPCLDAGEFSFGGDNFYYGYVGFGDSLCGGFEAHFGNLTAG